MSAHRTNIDKETRRHRPALTAMLVAVVFAFVLLAGFLIYLFAGGNTPQGADTQIRTGVDTVTSSGAPDTAASGTGAPAGIEADTGVAGTGGEADPAAVTVAPTTTTAPETPAGITADTNPGQSRASMPVNPETGAPAAQAGDDAAPAAAGQ